VFAVLVAASFAPLWWGRHSVALLIVGIIVLDVGVQGLQVTNQSLIYRLAPQARSRINSAYMVCYFIGGAVGSIVGSVTYEHERWTGVCVLGAGIGVIATLLALADSLNTTPHPSPRVEGGSASH
jgi:predicted MFS family arabinose efflux permease